MLKLIITMICFAAGTLASAQVINDPLMVDETGAPAQVRRKPSIRYQNDRTLQTPRLGPTTSPIRIRPDYTPRTGFDPLRKREIESPLRYNAPAPDERLTGDTVRVFFFDADGKRYRDPSRIYEDLTPEPPENEPAPAREESYNTGEDDDREAPWKRSRDSELSND